ncbi:hypothetical protein RTP6_002978 [Batrachochytrium dendrobatidis]
MTSIKGMLSKAMSNSSLSGTLADHTPTRKIYTNIYPPKSMFKPNGESTQAMFPSNEINTSKYTLLSFLPHNLFEQFRRFANIFFLTLAILQFFPTYQSINPWVAALPLILIITATCIKDAFEDYRRHGSDLAVNTQTTLKLSSWKNLNKPFMKPRSTTASIITSKLNQIGWILGIHRPRSAEDSRPKHGQIEPDTSLNDANHYASSVSSPIEQPSPVRKPDDPELSKEWRYVQWKDIKVGDLIRLQNNEHIPADLIILASSEPEGLCYIETKNLDGETNLKIRKVVSDTLSITTPNCLRQFQCTIECEKPHPSIYLFTGTLVHYHRPALMQTSPITLQKLSIQPYSAPPDLGSSVDMSPRTLLTPTGSLRISVSDHPSPTAQKESQLRHRATSQIDQNSANVSRIPININSMLLRGCVLRNTEWVYGIVVYTGVESKIRLNSGDTPIKRSLIEDQTNFYILLSLALMVILSIISAVMGYVLEKADQVNQAPWLTNTFSSDTIGVSDAVAMFWVAIILFQNLVPISLYITVEIVKSLQSFLIYEDIELYDETCNEPCIPRSWNLADDLGQIEYIFSDKTGTLTRNIMEFKRCSVNSVIYGHETQITSIEAISDESFNTSQIPSDQPFVYQDSKPFSVVQLEKDFCTFPKDSVHYKTMFEFFSCLSLCHTVLVSSNADTGDIIYKAQSPDEAALVDAAKSAGFVFQSRENTTVGVVMLGNLETFTILNILEFTSSRKRMSMILRRRNGEIVLYCKGADSVIFERLAEDQDELKTKTMHDLEHFAGEGLRTLCLAYAILSEAEYAAWERSYHLASVSLENREDCIEEASNLIEQNLYLLGATAIEDKLQEGVPKCIQVFLEAGIKIIVLTGDKLETAINIGYSCNLLTKDMSLIVIRGGNNKDDEGSTLQQMQEAIKRFFGDEKVSDESVIEWNGFEKMNGLLSMQAIGGGQTKSSKQRFGLVIDGRALFHALDDHAKDTLVDLIVRCDAVICCRVSPLQKAKVVQLIKSTQDSMCLAIGDGANDVGMIQAAHVGVGISGQEGLQAAMAADFVISQFRFLERLLLVHGRWCYVRTGSMILNFFFKNIIYTIPLFMYQIFCGFSAQPVYDVVYMILSNVLFTAVPVGILGAFDKDVSAEMAQKFPPLYNIGIMRVVLTHTQVLIYVAEAVYQGVVIFFVQYLALRDVAIHANGRPEDALYFSISVAICCLTMTNFFIAFSTHLWTWIVFAAILGTNTIIFVFLVVYMELPASPWPHYESILYTSSTFWLSFILTITLCSLPKFAYLSFSRLITPTDTAIAQEHEKQLQKQHGTVWPSHEIREQPHQYPPVPQIPQSRKRISMASTSSLARSRSSATDHIRNRRRSKLTPLHINLQLQEDDFFYANGVEERGIPQLTTLDATSVVKEHGFGFAHSPGARSSILPRLSLNHEASES